jgi:hypothetical protein
MVAWYLNLESVDVSDQMPDSIAGQPSPPDPNVILQARDTGTARLEPKIPTNEHYTEIRQRTFRLYEHCK